MDKIVKILSKTFSVNNEFIEKWTEFDPKNPFHKAIKEHFVSQLVISDEVEEIIVSDPGAERLTKRDMLEAIKATGLWDEEMKDLIKLNWDELSIAHAEIIG